MFSDDEKKVFLEQALVVLDTNTLLDVYSYRYQARKELFYALSFFKKQNRLWLPRRVADEFYNRRITIIGSRHQVKDELAAIKKASAEKIRALSRRHLKSQSLDMTAHELLYEHLGRQIIEGANILESNELKLNNEITDQFCKIFEEEIIGNPLPFNVMAEIDKVGSKRYEDKFPPGFEDDGKPGEGTRKYGDLIIWFEILRKSGESKRPILFVTNETKKDWFLGNKPGHRVPRTELIEEIHNKSGVKFWIYSLDEFLQHSKNLLNVDISNETVKELKRLRLESDPAFAEELEECKQEVYESNELLVNYINKINNLASQFDNTNGEDPAWNTARYIAEPLHRMRAQLLDNNYIKNNTDYLKELIDKLIPKSDELVQISSKPQAVSIRLTLDEIDKLVSAERHRKQ